MWSIFKLPLQFPLRKHAVVKPYALCVVREIRHGLSRVNHVHFLMNWHLASLPKATDSVGGGGSDWKHYAAGSPGLQESVSLE